MNADPCGSGSTALPSPHITALTSHHSPLLPQLSSLISHPFSLISHLFLPHPCSLTELIRIHKAPENGSNMDPDPQHCNATTRFSEISKKTSPTSTLQYRSTYVTHWAGMAAEALPTEGWNYLYRECWPSYLWDLLKLVPSTRLARLVILGSISSR